MCEREGERERKREREREREREKEKDGVRIYKIRTIKICNPVHMYHLMH